MRDNEIPQFASPEEEQEYWDTKSTLAQEQGNRVSYPQARLEAQLIVPMSAGEIARLHEISLVMGTDVTRLVREAIISFIGSRQGLTERPLPEQTGKLPGGYPSPEKPQRRAPEHDITPDREDTFSREAHQERRETDAGDTAKAGEEGDRLPLTETGDEMGTIVKKGTGSLFTGDERQFLVAVDYEMQEKPWTKEENLAWWGELVMMSAVPAGEYFIDLGEEDKRSGRIVIGDGEKSTSQGYSIYKYLFRGTGALIDESEELM
ncbi:MAG: hypothetical protein ABIB93_04390 [Chloroflexota bacterium]